MCTVGCSTFVLVCAMEDRIQLYAGAHVGWKFCFGCEFVVVVVAVSIRIRACCWLFP
jgi:hypothetical protein